MADQRLGRRLAPAERLEHLRGRRAAAAREDRVAEPLAELADRGLVLEAGLLERAEGVRRQHLGPLVRVVAARVAAGEDVREGAQEAVVVARREGQVLPKMRRCTSKTGSSS